VPFLILLASIAAGGNQNIHLATLQAGVALDYWFLAAHAWPLFVVRDDLAGIGSAVYAQP
jgi:hypothetical protein